MAKGREWTDTEDKIIHDNYPENGVIVTTRILHAAGFSDRDAYSVQKRASVIGVKRRRTKRWRNNYAHNRIFNQPTT